MSKLQELIDRLCPNGVEYKPLGEVATLSRGKVYSKEYLRDNSGIYPVYSSQTANNGVLGKIQTYDYDGEYLTWTTDGAYAGTIFHRIGKFSITNVCGLISLNSSDILLRFLYYWLSIEAPNHVYKGMGNPKLMSNQVSVIPIPIPPLEVQEEIVRILDRFADYAAELQADLQTELQARKEQYKYYRNLLLAFNPSACGYGTDDEQKISETTWDGISYKIQWKKLEEVGNLVTSRVNAENINFYVGVENLLKDRAGCNPSEELPPGDSHIEFIANDILIGNIRPYLNKIWLADRKGGTNGDVLTIRLRDLELTPKFLYHVLASDSFSYYHNQYAKGAKMPRGDKNMVMKYIIPVPPLELQERIVAILDRFETLVNDISKGLPAEIEAVKARYEYYRNKLLTFKPLPA